MTCKANNKTYDQVTHIEYVLEEKPKDNASFHSKSPGKSITSVFQFQI